MPRSLARPNPAKAAGRSQQADTTARNQLAQVMAQNYGYYANAPQATGGAIDTSTSLGATTPGDQFGGRTPKGGLY